MIQNKFRLLVLSLGIVLWSAAPRAEDVIEVVPQGVENPTKNQRRVCKTVAPTGTRIAKKTCLTVAQWEEARKVAQEATEKGQNSSLLTNGIQGNTGG
ncbi:MAG: hypothetical protein ACO4AL_11810 [Steroidobacteraceae bacterium]